MKIDGVKLTFFKDLYEEAKTHTNSLREKHERNLAQYKGSPEIDGGEDASTVRNITYELLESQVTSFLPVPAVNPEMWSEKNQRNAKGIETLIRNKRDKLPFEKMNDMDERFNPIYGGSVWLIEWDNSIVTHDTAGDIKVTCWSPKRFTGQPNIYEINEMEYCFIEFETTKEDLVRKYGVSKEVANEATSETANDDKTATVVICFYKNEEDKICQFIWSGESVLSDVEDYWSRKIETCKNCGKRKELCKCEDAEYEQANEEFEELDSDIQLTDGTFIPVMSPVIKDGEIVTETVKAPARGADGTVMLEDIGGTLAPVVFENKIPKFEKTKLPYYTPTLFPIVIRKNTSEEDNLYGQSDCEFIRPQQQAVNKIESRIMKKLMGSGVFPIVPEDFKGTLDNSLYEHVFRASPANINLYSRVDLMCDVSKDMAQSDRIYDHAKRILGITDSFQGHQDRTATSGVAKQVQVTQSNGRLDSKRKMKNAAYSEIDEIIFQLYLAYADEPRPAVFKDAQGRKQNVFFNRYDFIERDETGEYYYNDQYLFSSDSTSDLEKSREALWQENRLNFQQGAYGNPENPETLLIFWQNMEKAHYPWAHDNVERIREQIQTAQMMQQQQANIQQQGEQIKQLSQQNSEAMGYVQYINDFFKGGR